MNQDFYNSNLSGFDQFQPPQFPVNYPPQETSKEILQAQEDLMEAIQAFLKEYDHIPPNEKCMALLLAEERFLKIKQTMEEEQNQPGVMQELLLKLMDDLQILKGKPCSNYKWFKGISEIRVNVPVCEDPSTFVCFEHHSEILSDSNNDGTSSDDDSYENIEYVEASPLNLEIVSLEEVNKDQEEKEFDLEDIFQIQDVILREKLVNISRLITNIESLKDTLLLILCSNLVFFHILSRIVISSFETSDTSFSYSDNSLPEFVTFCDHTEESRSCSTLLMLITLFPSTFRFFEVEPVWEG
ncbi:hypothetical protein Tco_0247825 [Tanacetum coccineum]